MAPAPPSSRSKARGFRGLAAAGLLVCLVPAPAAADCGQDPPDVCTWDCDADGQNDACELREHPEADCNQNGILDGCERANDRNHNGIPDDCDLAAGTSLDCNHNGVPDEVEAR